MAFKVDGSKATSFEILPDGEYEVFITGAAKAIAKSGTEGVGLILTVRDDVDQNGAGRKVRHTVWITDKTEGMLQSFLVACQIPDGEEFDSIEDIAEGVKALPVLVRLGKSRNNPDFNEVKSFKKSMIGGFYEGEEEALPAPKANTASLDNQPIDISDDDLPF